MRCPRLDNVDRYSICHMKSFPISKFGICSHIARMPIMGDKLTLSWY